MPGMLLFAVFLRAVARVMAQDPPCRGAAAADFVLTLTISQDIVDFSVDNLGNIYVINSDNQLKKLSPKGDSLAVFNDVRRYGKIGSIDVTNPLKILVYYRDFTTIIELDRFLNLINTIDLRNQNILQAKAVGLAYDNNIWVLTSWMPSSSGSAMMARSWTRATDFRQLFDSVPDPVTILDRDGLVYLYDPAKGSISSTIMARSRPI